MKGITRIEKHGHNYDDVYRLTCEPLKLDRKTRSEEKRTLIWSQHAGPQFSILYPWNRNLLYIFLTNQKFKIFFSAHKNSILSLLGTIKEHSMLVVMTKFFF